VQQVACVGVLPEQARERIDQQLLTAGGGDISLVQKARGHRDIRTTLICTQVVVDPRLGAAVTKAFAMKPRVAGSRGARHRFRFIQRNLLSISAWQTAWLMVSRGSAAWQSLQMIR
jgi:hypothetical protein